jgi:hypothetical protein
MRDQKKIGPCVEVANVACLMIGKERIQLAEGIGNEQSLREESESNVIRRKLLDAGIILGIFCGCIAGVLWILKEVLKSLMEK